MPKNSFRHIPSGDELDGNFDFNFNNVDRMFDDSVLRPQRISKIGNSLQSNYGGRMNRASMDRFNAMTMPEEFGYKSVPEFIN